jgi:hypothetical protein
MQTRRALSTGVTALLLLLATAASALYTDCGGGDGNLASLGESCAKRECATGLTCGADAICAEQAMLAGEGESCIAPGPARDCQPGLVCAFYGVCERRPGLGEACALFLDGVPCEDGLECMGGEGGDGVCTKVQDGGLAGEGESCILPGPERACEPELMCAFSGVCERRPGLGEACALFLDGVPCEDGLECMGGEGGDGVCTKVQDRRLAK